MVINEYMPWPANSCGVTSEFVELLNYGPGPVDIGCYVLTEGDFAVTIPPHTILQPGQFYVMAGQDILPAPCGNIDSDVHASLNWNTCNCTSGTIPTTGDGLFTDGGSASEQVVLLNPSLKVVDAVVRTLPGEPSSSITTASVAGGCAPMSFDLDTMKINYEVLGMSAGRGNSFARIKDGDCGWVKQPQVSANATNNKGSATSSVSYTLTTVQSQDCNGTKGALDVYVNVSSNDYSTVFPMNYTVARDVNNDNVFDFSDQYTYGVDSTPPSVSITGLPAGHYNITVASDMGCFLHTFNVNILSCSGLLAHRLEQFRLAQRSGDRGTFEWVLGGMDDIQKIELEKSAGGDAYIPVTRLDSLRYTGTRTFDQTLTLDPGHPYYRLRVTERSGNVFFSPVINCTLAGWHELKLWPNPAADRVNVQFYAEADKAGRYTIYNTSGIAVASEPLQLHAGTNQFSAYTGKLTSGTYAIVVATGAEQPISLRFVKP